MHTPKLVMSALLLLTILLPAYSEVSVFLVTRGVSDDPRLQGIITRTVAIELEKAGLSARQKSEEDATGSTDPFFSRAAELDAPFLMIVDGELSDSTLSVAMSFYRTRKRTQLGQKRDTFQLGIDLDQRLLSAVRSLLESEEIQTDIAAALKQDTARDRKENPVPAEETARVGAAGPQQPPEASRRLEFGAGAAPVILVGASSDYFRYGVAVDVSALYRFRLFGIDAAGGVDITASRIFPASGLPRGTVYTVGGGPSLQLGSSPLQNERISLRLTGGAAALTARLPDGPLLAKTVAFAQADVRAELRISKRLSAGALLGFLVIFEKDYPVMGVLPGIAVSLLP